MRALSPTLLQALKDRAVQIENELRYGSDCLPERREGDLGYRCRIEKAEALRTVRIAQEDLVACGKRHEMCLSALSTVLNAEGRLGTVQALREFGDCERAQEGEG